MNIIYVNYKQCENNYNTFHFTKCGQICEYISALAKSKVSREKLNLLLANDSTPFNRAFFVRNIRTPNNKLRILFQHLSTIYFPMVAHNRQPFVVGCFPVEAVSHPVMCCRPTVRSLAVVSKNILLETTQMYQFIFAAIRRTDLTNHIQKIRIAADTEQAARAQFARDFVLVLTGKINLQNTVKNNRTFTAISRDSMEVAHA